MEAREEAVSRGLPVPHADSCFDDGLPSEEICDGDSDSMPSLTESDDDPEEWRRQSMVTHGNNFPCGLTPTEHVYLAVTASQLRQALEIPEELLLNIQWLFNLPVEEGHEATAPELEEAPLADEQAHRDMVDAFRNEVVSGWYTQAAKLHQTTIAWIANAPKRIFPAVQEWNGPLIDHLCKASFTARFSNGWRDQSIRSQREAQVQG